jgi:hypothetical protein
MSQNYTSIFFPQRTTICGKTLLPLTIGHLLILEHFKLSYALEKQPKEVVIMDTDIILTILFLCNTYKQNVELLNNHKKLKRLVWLSKFKNRWKYKNTKEQLHKQLCDYFDSNLSNAPVVKAKAQANGQQPKANNSPMLMSIVVILLNYFRFDIEECMDCSMPLAQWLIATRSEIEGIAEVEVIDEDQVALIDKVKNMDYNEFMKTNLDELKPK